MTDWRSGGPPDLWRDRVQAALAGAFVLERELNGGTTSRVFAGTETALCRQVVIKLLAPDASGTEQEAEFRREAMTAARLHHPHIVPVFTVGTVAGVPYYTMPFIEGESLRMRLDRAGALPAAVALRVLREIGSALAFAHELGVIHRDVKPENIALERGTGRALLGDFGIACSLGHSRLVTPAGTTVGTPVYMSPEQVDGLELDGRTDAYSLGLVAWEMLTGRRPWAGKSLEEVMYQQKHDPLPSLAECGVDVPQPVAAAIERALRKDRDERWQSVGDLLAAIDVSRPPTAEVRKGAARRGRAARETAPDTWAVDDSGSAVESQIRDPDTTIAMAVWRKQHAADHDDQPEISGSYSFGPLRPRETPREVVARRVRWVLAACGAFAVTAGLVAAMGFRQDIVRWSAAAGDVASRTADRVTGTVHIDTVPMDSAAAKLATLQVTVPPRPAPETMLRAARAVPIAQPAPSRARMVPVASDGVGLSARDAVRARAATATLALEAYQAAVNGSTPSAGTVTASPVVPPQDSLRPASAVRVRIRRAP